MGKLFFYFAAMNSGKSNILIQSAFNYEERGMHVLVLVPEVVGIAEIRSRVGNFRKAEVFDHRANLFNLAKSNKGISCVLIDEAQFLKKDQVWQLCRICDELDVPVLCYGLRTDYMGEPFEGSIYLMALADKLSEIKSICKCEKKTTMNLRRIGSNERFVPCLSGPQIDIGQNKYISLCRRCYCDVTQKYHCKVNQISRDRPEPEP